MKERDVRFILGNLAKTLNISNPYDDDYYYMQSVLKLHQSHVKEALENDKCPPPPPALPMPAWRELKERFQQQNAEVRRYHRFEQPIEKPSTNDQASTLLM
jgi:hypothetical protein